MLILEEYMEEAKRLAQKILMEKNLRNQPFSDTILREMGLDLPKNEPELLMIPGIDADMVGRYGKRFLRLINKVRSFYGPNVPKPKNQTSRSRVIEEDEDEEDQTPMDPNHRVVVDLCSSDLEDEGLAPPTDVESNYSSDEDERDDQDEDGFPYVSHHFQPAAINPRVEEYNRRGSQLEAEKMATTSTRSRGSSKPVARAGAKSRALPWKKGANFRKRSSGGSGKAYSGISKKGVAKKSTIRKESASGGGVAKRTSGTGNRGAGVGGRAGNGGGNGWSSIIAMPT